MRVLLKALCGLVYSHKLQKLPRPFVSLFFGFICVQKYNFHNLIPYCVNRVKACHRVLEYNGNLVSANFAELLFGHFFNFMPVKVNRTADQFTGVCGKPHY